MKSFITAILLVFVSQIYAQKPCDYSENFKDSIGSYKSSKETMIYERQFADKSAYVFMSLIKIDQTLTLQLQLIQKSKEFMKARCFDKSSNITINLINGKKVTLNHIDIESCGSKLADDKGMDSKLLSGTFVVTKADQAILKTAAISLVEVKFMFESENYVVDKNFKSQLNGIYYQPATFFTENIACFD